MADYFLVHDAAFFETHLRPALAESWRRHTFAPCGALCAALAPAARSYTARYHTGPEDPLLFHVQHGLPFDRWCWRALVGEVLLFAAAEIPEFPANTDALCCLLAPGDADSANRARQSPIRQALAGSRDLTFGTAVYRPEHAGFNDPGDVARLADYLAGVRPESWTPASLADLPGLAEDEERADELAFVRDWFGVLVDLYQRCRADGRVLVIERIY
jgi:hypothetical protein